MFKALTPLFAFIIAIGLVLTYVRPTFQAIGATQDELKKYTDTIASAQELRAELQKKIDQKRNFTPSQLERLEAMIPDKSDEIATILDIDALAREYRMSVSGISVAKAGSAQEGESEGVAQAENSGEALPYTTMDISFSLAGTYEDLRLFLSALEQSLVLYDVTNLDFGSSEGDGLSLNMTVRAYMFNAEK